MKQAWRGMRLLLVVGWSVLLMVGSIPDEIRPAALDEPFDLVRNRFFRKLNVQPSHFVFGGRPGDLHRKYWGARWRGVYADGSERVLESWPEDLHLRPVRAGDYDGNDVVWYRKVGMSRQSRLIRTRNAEKLVERVAAFRKDASVRRTMRFFCRSEQMPDHDQLVEVRLEAFWANQSYRKGDIRAYRGTLHRCTCEPLRCGRGDYPIPEDPPDWPLLADVPWEDVP